MDAKQSRLSAFLASLGTAQDRSEAEDAVLSRRSQKVYRALVVIVLLAQCVWSIQFQPSEFYHMYTNWSLFTITMYFVGAAWWSLVSSRDSTALHLFLSVSGIVGANAMVFVVPLYWGNGADKFNVNPGLMLLNHSWTWFLIIGEMVFLSGVTLRYIHFIFFLPYHYAYAAIALPLLQGGGQDPYDLPISYAEQPALAWGAVVVSPLLALLLGQAMLMWGQRRRLNKTSTRMTPNSAKTSDLETL
jgi:hypothetical protein